MRCVKDAVDACTLTWGEMRVMGVQRAGFEAMVGAVGEVRVSTQLESGRDGGGGRRGSKSVGLRPTSETLPAGSTCVGHHHPFLLHRPLHQRLFHLRHVITKCQLLRDKLPSSGSVVKPNGEEGDW